MLNQQQTMQNVAFNHFMLSDMKLFVEAPIFYMDSAVRKNEINLKYTFHHKTCTYMILYKD